MRTKLRVFLRREEGEDMKRAHSIVLALAVMFAPGLFATEKYSQCMDNCPVVPLSDCMKCCAAQAQTAAQPCRDKCYATGAKCLDAVEAKCKDVRCFVRERDECLKARWKCTENCFFSDWDIPGKCPSEKRPQKCPYNCQVWDSVSKSCIGPQKNSQYCK